MRDESNFWNRRHLLQMSDRDDPPMYRFVIGDRFSKKEMKSLESNTMIDSIMVCIMRSMALDVDYVALLNQIRSLSQLREMELFSMDHRIDMSFFIQAASENTALHSLNLIDAKRYSAESLGRLRAHPNLQELFATLVLRTVSFLPYRFEF
jgi:hypothetical protein